MFIQQISHNRRRQVALGTVSLALAGISTLTVFGGARHTALASPASQRSHRVTVGSVSAPSIVAEQTAAATLAGVSHLSSGTVRWLNQHGWAFGFVGSVAQASLTTTSASQPAAGSPTAPVQCAMSSHTSMRSGSLVSVCLNPQVDVPDPSGTVQQVRSLRHVRVTTPYYTPGRAPSATAPSAHIGTLPSTQTGHNDVTVNLGTRPSVTPGAVDIGTVGQVNAPKITIN